MLLTAQRIANAENRQVWLMDLRRVRGAFSRPWGWTTSSYVSPYWETSPTNGSTVGKALRRTPAKGFFFDISDQSAH